MKKPKAGREVIGDRSEAQSKVSSALPAGKFEERLLKMRMECKGYSYGKLCKPCESRIDGLKEGYSLGKQDMIREIDLLKIRNLDDEETFKIMRYSWQALKKREGIE